jgi:hypothetical protein
MKHRATVLALALIGCEFESETPERSLPVETEAVVVETWVPEEHECEQCHDDVAEQWSRSRHHAAFTNPDFARSYAREPIDFCRNCHAPALPRMAEAEAEHLGVGCIDCHFDGQTLLSSGDPAQASTAPHALRYTADFDTQSCARCHEFDFPEQSWRRGTMMQTTMREHRASVHAEQSCADCHMPGASHDFASTRDPAALRRAVSVAARREGDTLVLTLTPVGVGHAFPTGDLFRRLELHAELISREGETLASTTRYLARHFPARRHPDGRLNHAVLGPVPDDRLTGPTTIRLELEPEQEDPSADLIWWVDYERVDQRNTRAPERSSLADELRLAEGRL